MQGRARAGETAPMAGGKACASGTRLRAAQAQMQGSLVPGSPHLFMGIPRPTGAVGAEPFGFVFFLVPSAFSFFAGALPPSLATIGFARGVLMTTTEVRRVERSRTEAAALLLVLLWIRRQKLVGASNSSLQYVS